MKTSIIKLFFVINPCFFFLRDCKPNLVLISFIFIKIAIKPFKI
jgi:hypothetical protein